MPKSPLDDPRLPAAWPSVTRFLDGCIAPAARRAHLDLALPTTGDLFLADFPFRVRRQLQAFAAHDGRALPMNYHQVEAWHEFVVTAFRAGQPVDDERLQGWLVEHGFPESLAGDLAARFPDECLVLDRYLSTAPTPSHRSTRQSRGTSQPRPRCSFWTSAFLSTSSAATRSVRSQPVLSCRRRLGC